MAGLLYKDQPVVSFSDKSAFYDWLGEHHQSLPSFWFRFYKKASGVASISTSDAVDVALCWGWIDGLLNSYDEASYVVRYTPRRPKSVWSKVNVQKIERLLAEGLMQPSGLAVVEAAQADGRWQAAYSGQATMEDIPEFTTRLAGHPVAQATFGAMSRAERYTIYFQIATATSDASKIKRIEQVIEKLERRK